jgi:ABC-2 type transport system ATP-binding protein
MRPLVSVRGLSKSFGKRQVLHEVDFHLPAGAVTVLLGANAAGKSTLLRLLLGVLRPERGSMRVAGFDPVTETAEVRRAIGFVPDEPDVCEWMSARELFRFLKPQFPHWNVETERRCSARFALPLDTRFAQLSRGEATKVLLAATFAQGAPVLLLDEVFSGLDPIARDEVLALLLAELDLDGRTALVVTHELELAARIADRVLLLSDGRITQVLERDALHGANNGETPLTQRTRDLRALLVASEAA